MACKFLYNGVWYEEAQLEEVYNQMVSKFDSGSVMGAVELSQPTEAVQQQLVFKALSPLIQSRASIYNQIAPNQVDATMKVIDALQKTPRKVYPSNSINGFYNDLIKLGTPKNQIDLLKQHIQGKGIKEINTNDLITSLLAEMSYTIEINTAKKINEAPLISHEGFGEPTEYQFEYNGYSYWSMPQYEQYTKSPIDSDNIGDEGDTITSREFKEAAKKAGYQTETPTQYYSQMTVLGGTNYTENEIATPQIVPSIKGHAQFSTDNGIGWFRSDDKSLDRFVDLPEGYKQKLNLITISKENGKYYETHETQGKREISKENALGYINMLQQDKLSDSKTRRILEVQSDLFQKGRDKEQLTGKNKGDFQIGTGEFEQENILPDNKANQFLQLLNKDNNWVTFFVKSIIQDSAKKGYEKVLFPSGNTASKVEGHTTLEEFKKQKEDRLAKLENSKYILIDENVYQGNYESVGSKFKTLEQVEEYRNKEDYRKNWKVLDISDKYITEINQLKQELERVEKEGFGALKPIYNFYENTVTNILKKQGYNPVKITDEYGNTWNEIKITPELATKTILFQKQNLEPSKASPKTLEKVKEFIKRIGVSVKSLGEFGGNNGIADLLNDLIRVAEGKEDVALTEEAMHFAVAIMKQTNPSLFKQMLNRVGSFNYYQTIFPIYAEEYKLPDGRPDVLKIKEEAIGKILAEYLIKDTEGATEKPELLAHTLSWWDQIKNFFLALIGKAGFNPFQEAVKELEGIDSIAPLDQAAKPLADRVMAQKHKGLFGDIMEDSYKDGNYRAIISLLQQQLEDPRTYNTVKDKFLGGDEALSQEVLHYSPQMAQITSPSNSNLKDKFNKNISDFQLVKKLNSADPDDENNNSYYEITINGKTKKVDRTTEWAKREVIRRNGGRDYLALASKEKLKYWAKKAMSGSTAHAVIENNILRPVLTEFGTLKPKEQWQASPTNKVAAPIFEAMQKFFYGYTQPVTGDEVPGFLDQFPAGTKFIIEQQLYNDKTNRASTLDLIAEWPNGDIKIYDWKFMGFLLDKPDQNFLKRKQHILQLGDYKNTVKHVSGTKSNVEAQTVPIHVEYVDRMVKGENTPIVVSVTFGKVNIKEEKHTSLLPVIPEGQSSGNEHVDKLVLALNAHYKKLYSKRVVPEIQHLKTAELQQLSGAIRNLQIAFNFDPIAAEAQNFQNSIRKKLNEYKGIDWKSLSKEVRLTKLEGLEELFRSATTFTNIDQVFNDVYGAEDLSKTNEEIAKVLGSTSSAAKRVFKEVQNIQADYVVFLAKEKNIDNISLPTKEIKGVFNMFTEGGSIPLPAENLAVKLSEQIKAKAKQNLSYKLEREFEPKYIALAKLAGNRSPFSLIGEGDELIKETKKELWDAYKKAKEEGDKEFIKSIIDKEVFDKNIEIAINKHQDRIMETTYSLNSKDNAKIREQRIKDIHSALNIYSSKFTGFNEIEFDSIVKKAIIRKSWWTDRYKALHDKGNEAALEMHSFLTELNKEAFDLGILGKGHKMSFFALVTGSILERLDQASSKGDTTLQLFKDIGQVDAADKTYGERDDETGELKRTIPKLFTHTNRDSKDLSKDLLKVVPLWIRFIEDYKAATDLEYELITLEQFEEAKGHLEVEGNKVIFEGDKPKIFPGNVTNTNRLKSVTDWNVFGIRDKNNTIFDNLVGKVTEGTEEEKAKKAISAKRVLDNANKMTQVIAVGAKLSVAIPNAVGAFLQSIANSGLYYTGWEYIKNSGRVSISQLSTEEKALINLVVPLNDDVAKEAQRRIGKKTSFKKYLESWTMQEVLMESNRWPDKQHQITNAISFFQNSMVVDGKIVNIRQYLQSTQEFKDRYGKVKRGEEPPSYIKEKENEMEKKVVELQKTQSISKTAKFNEEGEFEIPGVDLKGDELSEYKTKIADFGRKITGQMSQENVADSRKDILVRSFMMFKNWIPKQITVRALDIKKNINSEQWEYGRTRLFIKTIYTLGFRNITKIRDIMTATPEGIRIMEEMLAKKKEEYYKKTGHPLAISEEEFYDMVRKELAAEWKELQILFYVVAMVVMVKAAAPPDDETLANKNRYKFWGKIANKISNEIDFYYNPTSAESITRGSILPALGLLTRTEKFLKAFSEETSGYIQGDDEKQKDAHPIKYFMNIFPITSTFQNELFPLLFPEQAKEHGIITTSEARIFQ